jgi:hypothetical protein
MRRYFKMSDEQITTYNLSDSGDGMVSLTRDTKETPSTAFVTDEKNVRQDQKEMMDSTSIADIMEPEQPQMMMAPPAMDPRMQGVMPQMTAPQAGAMTSGFAQPMAVQEKPEASKNPMGLTDDQMTALFVGACAAAAVSKPVQDKLVTSVPKFLNEQGSRSAVGLAATGAVAAVLFYFGKNYVITPN